MPTRVFFQPEIYIFAGTFELQTESVEISPNDFDWTRIRVVSNRNHRTRIVSKLVDFAALENNLYMCSVISKITIF